MGTRSLTKIENEDGKTLLTIYRQYDGYFSGMGKDLYNFAKAGRLVNGYSGDGKGQFNGMGCFAAQLIVSLKGGKTGAGNIYLEQNSLKWGCADDEYNYRIFPSKDSPNGIKIMGRPTGGEWVEIWPLPSIQTATDLKLHEDK